jgi:hypothetical protein
MGGLVVGLDGPTDEATADINLAHNLFNSNAGNDVFNGRITFDSLPQFMKFLILKEKFVNGGCLRSAAKVARSILTEKTIRADFMRVLREHSTSYYNVHES